MLYQYDSDETRLNVLKRARALISDPKHWIKYEYAKNEHGLSVSNFSDTAKCFCALGALNRASSEITNITPIVPYSFPELQEYIARKHSSNISALWAFNDAESTRHEDVLAAFDAAITEIERKINA